MTVYHISGTIDQEGNGGWGVTVYNNGVREEVDYSGHILTNDKITAEKMALIMALAIIKPDQKAHILTNSLGLSFALYNPNLKDVFDEEIAHLATEKPAVVLFTMPLWCVQDAEELAQAACKQR